MFLNPDNPEIDRNVKCDKYSNILNLFIWISIIMQFICISALFFGTRRQQLHSVSVCDFNKKVWSLELVINQFCSFLAWICVEFCEIYTVWVRGCFSSIILRFSVAFLSICRRFSIPLVGIFPGNGRKFVWSSSTVNFSWYST